jgi:hypothetical protein
VKKLTNFFAADNQIVTVEAVKFEGYQRGEIGHVVHSR